MEHGPAWDRIINSVYDEVKDDEDDEAYFFEWMLVFNLLDKPEWFTDLTV